MQTSTETPPRSAHPRVPSLRRKLSSTGLAIYLRMRALDLGQGCAASMKVLAGADNGFCITPQHCARVVAKLRRQGLIRLEGQTLNQCNLYTFPDRKYDRAQLEKLLVLPAATVRP